MGNRSKFSGGHKQQQQQLDYRPSSSINQTGSSRESHQLMFEPSGQDKRHQQEQPSQLPADSSSSSQNPNPNPKPSQPAIKIGFERENPTKITHGFWLQQYTWLHDDNSLGGCASDAAGNPLRVSNLAEPSLSPAARRPRAVTSRRKRLLDRWNNLVRTFGGSHGDSLANQAARPTPSMALDEQGKEQQRWHPAAPSSAPSTAHSTLAKSAPTDARPRSQQDRQFKWASPSRWRPASSGCSRHATVAAASTKVDVAHNPDEPRGQADSTGGLKVGSGDRRRVGRWFSRPLSSSACTLMPPVAVSVAHQQPDEAEATKGGGNLKEHESSQQGQHCGLELPGGASAENRSRSSCELRTLEGAEGGSPRRLASPYRQIVRALASKSPARKTKKQQQLQQQQLGLDKLPAPSERPSSQPASASIAGKAPHQGSKRSRLMQFAFSASGGGQAESAPGAGAGATERATERRKGEIRHQSAGLLGSLFVSPLFRRCEAGLVAKFDLIAQKSGQQQQQQRGQPGKQDLKSIDGDKRACSGYDFQLATSNSNKKRPIRAKIRGKDGAMVAGVSREEPVAAASQGAEAADCSGAGNLLVAARENGAGELGRPGGDGQLRAAPRGVPEAWREQHSLAPLEAAGSNGHEEEDEARRIEMMMTEVCSRVVGGAGAGGHGEVDQQSWPERKRLMQVCLSGEEEKLQMGPPTMVEKASLVHEESGAQSSCSEFKFQLERRQYYANETKGEPEEVVATTTTTTTTTTAAVTSDCQPKCSSDDVHGGDRVSGRPVECGQPKRETRARRSLEKVEVALSKRVKVIYNGNGTTQAAVVPLDHHGKREQESLNPNSISCVGQNQRGGLESDQQYERFDNDNDDNDNLGITESYDKSREHNMENNNQCEQTNPPAGSKMRRPSKREKGAIEASDLRSAAPAAADDASCKLDYAERSLLALIQPLASSSSSFSSICFDSTSQQYGGHESDNEVHTSSFASEQQHHNQQHVIQACSTSHKNLELIERPASTPVASRRVEQAGARGAANQIADGQTTAGAPAASGAGNRQKVGHTPSSSGVGLLKNNFKKLVKRQQSVDSYRMARDLKNKLKRQHEVRNKHQSNEAIKTKSVGDGDQQQAGSKDAHDDRRKFSMLNSGAKSETKDMDQSVGGGSVKLRICIDPYAKPGSFTLPGEDRLAPESGDSSYGLPAPPRRPPPPPPAQQQQPASSKEAQGIGKLRVNPTPPNTLSLMPQQPGAFIVGSFSGCITATYPTHHLPSPKYGPPANKKYSNASTVSSSLGGESQTNYAHGSATTPGQYRHHQLRGSDISNQTNSYADGSLQFGAMAAAGAVTSGTATNQSDTESSLGGGGPATPSKGHATFKERPSIEGGGSLIVVNQSCEFAIGQVSQHSSRGSGVIAQDEQVAAVAAAAAAAAAARRAQLAEHIYDNKCGLGEDMKFLASLPELCDITFLVGETREPVCAVKSVLAARSRVFHKILFGNWGRRQIARQQRQHDDESQPRQQMATVDSEMPDSRRGSSPKPPAGSQAGGSQQKLALMAKSSSPMGTVVRNMSPNQQQQQQQQQWSVMADTSGYNPTGPSVSPVQSTAGEEQQSRSGRASVTSNGGRDSGISQTSQGSQQPLIIGPGQVAAPAPNTSNKRNKKSFIRDGSSHHGGSRLSRMFMKRASDPSIKQQNQLTNANHTAQNYLDKMSSSQMSTTMIIEEFEPDVFRQLIEYIHTGCVLLQARTLLGLLNAADYYGLEQLRKACLRFVSCCITVDTVCSLLSTAERYIQYKCTKSIVQKVLEFVDTHADEIFKLNAFGLLPEHVVRLILSRDGLQADEHVKYNGVYTWCEHYCRSYELTNISDVMRNFIDLIQFHKIPTNVLLSEIYPTHIVPDNIFLSALAYQADPLNFEPQPMQKRRMTLPNPTIQKPYGDGEDNGDLGSSTIGGQSYEDQENEMLAEQSRTSISGGGGGFQDDNIGRKRKPNELQTREPLGAPRAELHGPQKIPAARGAVRSRKSTGGQPENGASASASAGGGAAGGGSKASKLRKGSIAQVSISGVMRLSHKLSMKKRSPNVTGSHAAQSRRRIGSIASSSNVLPISRGKRFVVSKQHSAIDGAGAGGGKDPMQLGQQILNAYLEQQRQRELELEERKRREELERLAAQEAKRRSEQASGETGSGLPGSHELQLHQQQQQESHHKQAIVKSSSTRKSFKDFRHISRRIFMRHSSSKMLQQQHSSASSTTTTTTIAAAATVGQQQQQLQQGDKDKDKDKDRDKAKARRRNMLKIKRSETVIETTATSSGT